MSTQEFNSLVLNNSDGLRPFAITLTRSHEAAKDLCQETLYKAFAYRDKYKSGTNIKAWLYTIMRNIFINDYRRKERGKIVFGEIKYMHNPFEPPSESNVILREINESIYELPSIFKTACLLYLEGFKYHEIADCLNEPLGTIKSRIHFAKKMLHNKIER